MRRQATADIFALFAALAIAGLRSGLWTAMALVMGGLGGLVHVAALPFWSPSVTQGAVDGSNLAIIVITLAISASYDNDRRWLAGLSISPAAAATASLLVRAVLTGGAVCFAVLLQGLVANLAGDIPRGRIAESLMSGLWTVLLVAPWCVLFREALGRWGAPWALLALALVASWVPSSTAWPWAAARWPLPVLPVGAHPRFVTDPSAWLYAVSHAICVTFASALLWGRRRIAW